MVQVVQVPHLALLGHLLLVQVAVAVAPMELPARRGVVVAVRAEAARREMELQTQEAVAAVEEEALVLVALV